VGWHELGLARAYELPRGCDPTVLLGATCSLLCAVAVSSVEIAFPAVGPSYAVIRDLSSYRLTNFSALWEEGCPDGVHLPSSAIAVGLPMARKALLEFDVPSFTFFEHEDFPATYATDRIGHTLRFGRGLNLAAPDHSAILSGFG